MSEKSKSGSVIESKRGANRVEMRIKPGQTVPLNDGDHIRLTFGGMRASVHWRPITICLVNVDVDSDAALARLGVGLIRSRHIDERCTHVCLRQTRPSKSLLLALVYGMHIVSPSFVHALAGIAEVDTRPAPLALPDPASYAPPADPRVGIAIEPLALRPNKDRRHLFRGCTVLFIVSRIDRSVLDAVEVCEAAEAHVVIHDVNEVPISSYGAALNVIVPIFDKARERARGYDIHVPLLIVCVDDAPWTGIVAQSTEQQFLNQVVFAPQGTQAVSECIIGAHGWQPVLAVDDTWSDLSIDEFPPTQPSDVLVQATQTDSLPSVIEIDSTSSQVPAEEVASSDVEVVEQ
ncbi:hypothetical protein MCUN1_001610 [Malassezia cuniculi]|uniref:Uncharacterized protein n=1 Tax=Malassezia cuniculi TaxID=948313 RepID=A0AAF0EUV6_9BASI|nr:hypothetical protein MCUN1_001610 [Malassezia cuniculi]